MRIQEMYPPQLVAELLRLYRILPDWIRTEIAPESYQFRVIPLVLSAPLSRYCANGSDWLAMLGLSNWLGRGPKIFRPSVEQQRTFENIDVNLNIADYQQPYPALWIVVDVPPFTGVLLSHYHNMLTCALHTSNHENEIITTIKRNDQNIEDSIRKYDDDLSENIPLTQAAGRALRIAINSALMLTNYPIKVNPIFGMDYQRDEKLAKERDTERGKRARDRLALAILKVEFQQEIKFHKTESREPGAEPECTGREISSHWRRGHWRMQHYGPRQEAQRKRIYVAPVLVRADKFIGDTANTGANYR